MSPNFRCNSDDKRRNSTYITGNAENVHHQFVSSLQLTEPANGLCTTQDLNIFLRHMNNARYLRELDFARLHYFHCSGFLKELLKQRGTALQSACNVRYRRAIPIFTLYRVNTRMVHWDEKNIYLEHQFVTFSDNFVRAIAFSKQITVGVYMPDLMKALGESVKSEAPPELKCWLESMEISSAKLRNTD